MALGPLQETIKQNGQLFQTSKDEVGNLSSAAGLSTPPTSPQETQVIGGSPQQAAMAGGPAQQGANAVRMAVKGQQDLATALRQKQVSSALTPEQRAQIQAQQQIQAMGSSLEARVPQLIQTAIAKGTGTAGTSTSLVADDTQLASNPTYAALSDADKATFKTALQKVGSSTGTNADVAQVNKLLGHDASHLLTSAELQTMFMAPDATLGTKLAGATPESVTIGQLSPKDLGVDSFDQIDQDLGLAPGAAAKMTVAQLGAAVAAVKTKGYSSADQWRQELADPTTSTQERETARTMLRAMGASGVKEAEAKFSQLRDQVQASNQVQFNGKSMSVDDVLSSDNMKATVASYIHMTDAEKATFRAAEPEMATWIDSNTAALKSFTSNVPKEATDFATLQSNNTATLTGIADPTTRDAVGKLLHPNWGQPTAEVYTAPTMLTQAAAHPKDAAAVSDAVSSLIASGDAAGAQDLVTSDYSNLTTLGDGSAAAGLAKYTTARAQYTTSQNIGPTTDPTSVVEGIFGPTSTVTGVAGQIKTSNAATTLLGAPAASSSSMLKGDGSLNMDSVASALKNSGGFSLYSMAHGQSVPPNPSDTLAADAATTAKFVASQPAVVGDVYNLIKANGGALPADALQGEIAKFSKTSGADGFNNMEALGTIATKSGDKAAIQSVATAIDTMATTQAAALIPKGAPQTDTLNGDMMMDSGTAQSYTTLSKQLVDTLKDPNIDPHVFAKVQLTINRINEALADGANKIRTTQAAKDAEYKAAADTQAAKEAARPVQRGEGESLPAGPAPTLYGPNGEWLGGRGT